MERIHRFLVALVAGASAALVLGGSAFGGSTFASAASIHEGVQDFTFDSYSADYFLGRDAEGHATLRTVETFIARFPQSDQNRGMIRAIPNDYDGVPLRTSVESVVDEKGAPVHFEATNTGGFTELALGTDDFVHGRTTYTITYTQQNVVRAFTDTNDDEFYWDTNGTGFDQPFGSVSARVHLDPSLTQFLTGNNACYRGAQGSSDSCEISHLPDAAGDLFTASATNLGPGENVTVVIGFTLGTFVQVPPETQPDDSPPFVPFLQETPPWLGFASIGTLILTVLGAAFTVVWRFVKPKSSKGSGIIIPQYTPPKDLNLMDSANLIGRAGRGVPAQVVSFAVRGKLRILDYPVTSSGASYTLQLLSLDGLDAAELELMKAIFVSGGERTLALIKESGILSGALLEQVSMAFSGFGDEPKPGMPKIGAVQEVGVVDDPAARAIDTVTTNVRNGLIDHGLLTKRSPLLGVLTGVGMFILAFASMGFFIVSTMFATPNFVGILGFILAIIGSFVCFGFAYRPAVPTAEGAEHRDYLLGIRDYLQLAEADRLRMLQSPEGADRVRVEGIDPSIPAQKVKLYEKLLPFAVLWGIENEWAKEIAIYYTATPPDWFVSTSGFDAARFSVSLGSLASTSVARATPSTSTGSSSWSGSSGGSFSGGSFGGGFSGGGGGGGGGGGR